MTPPDHAIWLTASGILPHLRLLIGEDVSSVDDWAARAMVGGGGDELGVWEVTGTATVGQVAHSWTMYLKGWAAPDDRATPTDWDWPPREARIYESAILDDLPAGLSAPRYLGTTERPDGTIWLWLEGVVDDVAGPWPLERYARAARHLGELNATLLVNGTVPDQSWLSRGWLRQWVEEAGPSIHELARSADHPLVRRVLPSQVAGTLTRVWDERDGYLALLEAMPQTFCHLDAFRRNLITRQQPDGSEQLVAIDWGFAGIAAVGEEIAPLVAASLFFAEVPADDAQRLEDVVFAGYIDGLHSAGWEGDAELIRAAYRISVVLRYGIGALRGVMFYLLDEQNQPRIQRMLGMPMDDVVDLFSLLEEWIADMSDDARNRLEPGHFT